MAKLSYKKLDAETFEETEDTRETVIRKLDRAELQTKINHWKQDQARLQLDTDDKLADLQRDIERVEAILATV